MSDVQHLIDCLRGNFNLRSASKIVSKTMVIRVTRRLKPHKKNSRDEFAVTIGSPNYKALKFIKLCVRAKEPFPVIKIQFEFYPKKKRIKYKEV